MTSLLALQKVTKGFGERPLFSDLTLHLAEDERLGLIGPNGAGKTTLLRLLGGRDTPDEGERVLPRPIRTGWVEQAPDFPAEATLEQVLLTRLAEPPGPGELPLSGEDDATFPVRTAVTLGRLGFPDPQARVGTLSGGWLRRLAIARALVNEPDLLLLDEPTNHLDLESILWLERFLSGLRTAYVVISHDRAFLEAVATRVLEVDGRYPGGTFLVAGRYHELLEKREAFFAAEASRRVALETKVAREVEWLSRGPKARTTKARGRIDEAERLQAELVEMKARGRVERTQIDFSATERKTRRLLVAEDLGCRRGGRWLFRRLDLLLRPGLRVGLVGPNGSGKTTLLQVLAGELAPDTGTLRTAPHVETVYFDQQREQLDPGLTLRRALAPEGDSVLHQGRPIHVAGWARRFRFRSEQLDTPLGRLSGGEQAKVLIARLMLRPADLLFLDEPTNDLDLPTLEVLEEALLEFPGAVVMVTHDRYLLDRVSNVILGLGGAPGTGAPGGATGGAPGTGAPRGATTAPETEGLTQVFADVDQWLAHRREASARADAKDGEGAAAAGAPAGAATRPKRAKKALTYGEEIELGGLEPRIAEAEASLAALEAGLTDPAVVADAARLAERYAAVQAARAALDALVERWAELEEKKGE